MKKEKKTMIECVDFAYVGTDQQFNDFLKSVIRDYVSEDKIQPGAEPNAPDDINQIA